MRYFQTRFNLIFFVACFLLFSIPDFVWAQAPSQDQQKTYNATQYVLDNGMDVVVVPNTRVPAVTHMVWYKIGAADEIQGVSGIAHFMEHLMFKGSPVIGGDDLGAGEFSHTVRRLGGNDNAFTSQDYTAYFQSLPREHLGTVMRMEAGRMKHMNLTEEDIASERAVILEERSQRTDNDPEALLIEQLKAALYPDHPYGIPVIGWRNEMEKLSMDDAITFHDTWYRPNNAVLVVAGDVTPDEVLKLAQETYGTISPINTQARTRNAVPKLNEPAQNPLIMRDSHVRQPVVYTLLQAPSATQDKQTALALEILADIMGGGPSSRLYTSLVIDQKIATSASLSYDPQTLDSATIWVHAIPAPQTSSEDVLNALNAEIEKLLQDGITEQELTDSITRLQNAAIYARDSLSGPAMDIGRALAVGQTLDDVEYWPRDIGRINTIDVMNAARAVFAPETQKSVTGFLLPEDISPDVQGETP